MNKIIFTDERLFMSIVGPSGCGKTQLIFSMLAGDTFYPNFKKIYFFYHHYQPLYRRMQETLPIEFVSCIDFEMISQLENCLLVFDDSCEEIYDDKAFAKLAVSGRHKNLHVIYVKHNLFHQSKLSRTIDLNTTHIILFNSPRDIQQITHFARQLNKTAFLKDAYANAVAEQYGHLIIDLDPKTSEKLRYCSNITGPFPSVFYLPSSKAVVSVLSNEREKRAYTETLAKVQPITA